jgi:hypothetical protein
VFLVNSCQRYFRCAPHNGELQYKYCSSPLWGEALFRSYGCFFAEFLEDLSLVRLGLLDLITCVGLRYGFSYNNLRSFSWKCARVTPLGRTSARDIVGVDGERICLSSTRSMPTGIQLPAHSTTLRPSFDCIRSHGILTMCPSTATFVIALGPD